MKMFRFVCWLLMGLFCAFPLVCLSSGIYKVEDAKGHVTYTNTPSAVDNQKKAIKLTGAAPINIVTPRSSVTAKYGNMAATSRPENNYPSGLQKHDLDSYQIADQYPITARSIRLGDSLRASDVSAVSAHNATQEKLTSDQLSIDDYNIQVFDLKIRSY